MHSEHGPKDHHEKEILLWTKIGVIAGLSLGVISLVFSLLKIP